MAQPGSKTDPRLWHLLRLAIGIALLAGVIACLWCWPTPVLHRLRVEWWPPDNSTFGPNVCVLVLVAVVGFLFWRPVKFLVGDYQRKLDRNARLMRHIIEHSEQIPDTNRHGHSLLDDSFLQDPAPHE